jgi:ferredoxin
VVDGDPAPPTDDELRVLAANRAEPGHRLACRLDASHVRRVHASYWPK